MFDFSKTDTLEKVITVDFILSRISEEAIFRQYFPPFEIGPIFHSPFREDKNPSFGFYRGASHIKASDLAREENWNCFQFVMKLYGIGFPEALEMIANDFGLMKEGKIQETKPTLSKSLSNKERVIKSIKVITCPFNKEILDYWSQFYITKDELEINNCFNFSKYAVKKDKEVSILTHFDPIKTAYYINHEGKSYWKIYQPLSDKYKWISCIPNQIPYGLDSLPYASDTLLITKSNKDMIIGRKFHTDVIGTQNESLQALSLIKDLPYKRKIVMFDNDEAGKKAAVKVKNELGFETVETDDKETKDLGEYIFKYKPQKTKELCQNLLNT